MLGTDSDLEIIEIEHLDFDIPCDWYQAHEVIHQTDLPAAWAVWLSLTPNRCCNCGVHLLLCDPCLTYMQTTEAGAQCDCGCPQILLPFRRAIIRTERLKEKPRA